jgi:hypothetical protein
MHERHSETCVRNARVHRVCGQITQLATLSREQQHTLDILLTQLESLARRANAQAEASYAAGALPR